MSEYFYSEPGLGFSYSLLHDSQQRQVFSQSFSPCYSPNSPATQSSPVASITPLLTPLTLSSPVLPSSLEPPTKKPRLGSMSGPVLPADSCYPSSQLGEASFQQLTVLRKRLFSEREDAEEDHEYSDPQKCRKCSVSKRVRLLSGADEEELRAAEERVLVWLNEQQTYRASCMPKTLPALIRACASRCKFTVYADPRVVFYHLLFNKVLVVVSDAEDLYAANPECDLQATAKCFVGFIPAEETNETSECSATDKACFSEDFMACFWKAAYWLKETRNTKPVSMESLMPSLAQVCMVKRDVRPELVVEQLKRKGFVIMAENSPETIIYALPAINTVHYLM